MSTLFDRIMEGLGAQGVDSHHPQVCVVAPSNGSHGFLRRRLLTESPTGFLRFRFVEPEQLVRQMGERILASQGLRPEPPGWLETVIAELLEQAWGRAAQEGEMFNKYLSKLSHPGWLPYLANALRRLDGAGLQAESLRQIPGSADPARIELLAWLQDEVQKAQQEAELFSGADAARAASACVENGTLPRPIERDQALVVYGDRTLAPAVFDALQAWLQIRPCLRLVFHPQEAAPVAATGLRRAAEHAPTVRGESEEEEGPLPALRRHLLQDPPAMPVEAEAPRGAFRIVRAIDDGREMREVVREVLQALKDGAPADGVAIALPSAEHIQLLQSELDRAGLTASYLAGPPLSSTPAARALLTLVDAHPTTLTPKEVYERLEMPELRRPAQALGTQAGAGRWRRHLVDCGLVQGLDAIQERLRQRRLELQRTDPEHADISSLDALSSAVDAVGFACRTPAEQSWLEWRRHFRIVVDDQLRTSPDADRLSKLLDAGGPATLEGSVARATALALLRSLLDAEAFTAGTVNQPCIRVAPPLALVGSRFHTVIVPGLTDQSFPAPPSPDPVLNDELLQELRAHLGSRLEGTEVNEDLERRRLAAVVGAARERLVFTWGKSDMMKGRALQPSPYLDEVVASLGHGRGPGARQRFQVDGATQSTGLTRDPSIAVNEAEAVLARVAQSDEAAIAELVAEPGTRRIVESILSQDRVRSAEGPVELDAYTGRISPELIQDDGWSAPIRIDELALLIECPARFLMKRILGVHGVRRFPAPIDVTDEKRMRNAGRSWLLQALKESTDWTQGFHRRLEDQLRQNAAMVSEDARPLVESAFADLGRDWLEKTLGAPDSLTISEDTVLHDELPWRLASERLLVADGKLLWPQKEGLSMRTKRLEPGDDWPLSISLTALSSSEAPVRAGRLVRPSSQSAELAASDASASVLTALQHATARARAGLFPNLTEKPAERTRSQSGLLGEDPGVAVHTSLRGDPSG